LLHTALLLAFVPALRLPFSWPKLALLCAGAALALALPRRNDQKGWPALLWLALVSAAALAHPVELEALLRDGAAALLLYALLTRTWPVATTLRAIAWLGCVEALIVLAQAPFAARRLDLFGTLGNPDFAAGWLGVSLCLTLAESGMLAAALLQVAALAVLGSFASVLALGAACLVALPRKKLAPVALAALCLGAASRNLESRVAGRLELDRIAARHLLDAPLLGIGSVKAVLPQPQDHVHDDLLERALEQGWPCALLLAGIAAAALRKRTAAAAALASIAARSFVDFPLARPAELALFVTLAAACLTEPECTKSSSPSSSPLPPAAPSATG
jgi:hypothetical protein